MRGVPIELIRLGAKVEVEFVEVAEVDMGDGLYSATVVAYIKGRERVVCLFDGLLGKDEKTPLREAHPRNEVRPRPPATPDGFHDRLQPGDLCDMFDADACSWVPVRFAQRKWANSKWCTRPRPSRATCSMRVGGAGEIIKGAEHQGSPLERMVVSQADIRPQLVRSARTTQQRQAAQVRHRPGGGRGAEAARCGDAQRRSGAVSQRCGGAVASASAATGCGGVARHQKV